MNVTICTIGELLVEFLAKEENQGFSRPGEFWGPYPSGAPAIFADQVAKLGFGSVLFSCVGIWRDEYCAAGERRRQRQRHRYAAESDYR